MNKLFVGKFGIKEQLDGNYYRTGKLAAELKYDRFNGLKEGDFVLTISSGKIKKLLQCKSFENIEGFAQANFDLVLEYKPELSLIPDIVCCKYFQPDLNLLNKAIKSTKGLGFIDITCYENCPPIKEINFLQDKRRFFVCLHSRLSDIKFFKPSDICIVIDDLTKSRIEDILEFTGQDFVQQKVFWALYQDKVSSGNHYSIEELLNYADENHDNAPNKLSYLKALIGELKSEGFFAVDNPVALYDNVIVGRKQYSSTKVNMINSNNVDNVDDDESNLENEKLKCYEKYAKLLEFNPNMILYGPPGTGKTYGAMKIIEAFEQYNGNNLTFNEVVNDKRAKFIIFHQAFSYEEFVEGIRPETEDDGTIRYDVKPGVLKEIVEDCRLQTEKLNFKKEALRNTQTYSRVWKVSLGRRYKDEEIYRTLRDNSEIAIGYGPNEDVTDWEDSAISSADGTGMLRVLHSKMQVGDIVLIFNSETTIRHIGVVTGDYFYKDSDSFGYRHRRKVEWLKNCEENPIDIISLNNGKRLTLSSLYETKISVADAIKLIDNLDNYSNVSKKPYYLIIDEINRGNIAKIFGELITLIEKDKRESLSSVLPYSKEKFTIPKDLYIIGTMNTSDRSIALLDTALRRRFVFVELNPDIELVEQEAPTIGGNVSPAKLLFAINNIIAKQIDREHRIGHSYFLGGLVTKYDLYNVWYYKIIPLLMEYFYNDTDKISYIIGKEFFDGQNIVYLSLQTNQNGISDFESALMKIYNKEA